MEFDEIEDKIIADSITGSQLYGTATPTSDFDYVGITFAPIEYVLGFDRFEELNCSIVSKNTLGKNTSDAVDKKYYEYRKFMKLMIENNPNIIEILWSNKLLVKTNYFQRIIDNRERFLHKGLIGKFVAYAHSQKHKMMIKPENYFELFEFDKIVTRHPKNDYHRTLIEIVFDNSFSSITEKLKVEYTDDKRIKFIAIGDLRFNPAATIGMVKTKVAKRLALATHREDLFTKFGYDTKFASHLLRLLYEGKSLLEEQKIEFPLIAAPILKDVKAGKYTAKQVIEIADSIENSIDYLKEKSELPSKPGTFGKEFTIAEMTRFYIDKEPIKVFGPEINMTTQVSPGLYEIDKNLLVPPLSVPTLNSK